MCGNDRNRKFIKDELGKEHEYIVTIAEGLIKKQGKNRTVTPLTGTVITSDYNSPASFSNTTDSGGSAQSR
ncbi:MAG: hypothetical protein LBB13_02570 [Rickettsiales bacterium]|nr:hypothetical protein [Rickettsiales bacterium]